MTSHAAVVARGMGTCCVAGCGEIKINEEEKYLLIEMARDIKKEIRFHLMVQQVMFMVSNYQQ